MKCIIILELVVCITISCVVSGVQTVDSVCKKLAKIEQWTKDQHLMDAIIRCQEDNVRRLLASGANPNAHQRKRGGLFATPYFHALAKKNSNICAQLRSHGASLIKVFPESHDFSNLFVTCSLLRFNMQRVVELFKDLWANGCLVKDDQGRTFLHRIGLDKRIKNENYTQVLKALAGQWAKRFPKDIDMRDMFGNTSLYYIARSSAEGIKKQLLACGADQTGENLLGDRTCRVQLTSKQFGYHRPNDEFKNFSLPYERIIGRTPEEIIDLFPRGYNFFDVQGVLNVTWHTVSVACHIFCKALKDLNKQDKNGNTLLHHIASINNSCDVYAICKKYAELVDMLFQKGAEPNKVNAKGHTPLHIASFNNKSCLIPKLLDAGADPLCQTLDGKRPRDFSCDARTRTILAEKILNQRKEDIIYTVDRYEGSQRVPAVITHIILDYAEPEIDETTGNIKMNYDD